MSHIALYAILGNAAFALNAASFWMKNVRWLRMLQLAASACFIGYAAVVPGGPLTIMIGWSVLFAGINVVRLFDKRKESPLLVIHRQGGLPLGTLTNVRGLRVMVVDRANLDGDGVVVVPPAHVSLGASTPCISVDPAEAHHGGVLAGYRFQSPVYAAGVVGRLSQAARPPAREFDQEPVRLRVEAA